jgi:hypothetical protein
MESILFNDLLESEEIVTLMDDCNADCVVHCH